MNEERDEAGRFRETYADEEFLEAIETVSVPSTQNIADEVGCSYDLAYHRLKALEQTQSVGAEQVGQAFIWFRVE